MERSLAAAKQADIILMVVDAEAGWTPSDADIFLQMFGGSSGSSSNGSSGGLSSDWGSDAEGAASSSARGTAPALLVLNKTDLAAPQRQQQDGGSAAAAAGVPQAAAGRFAAVVETSAATLEGMDSLRDAVLRLAGAPQVRAVWHSALGAPWSRCGTQHHNPRQPTPQLAPGGVGWAVNVRQSEALIRAGEALQRVQASIAGGWRL